MNEFITAIQTVGRGWLGIWSPAALHRPPQSYKTFIAAVTADYQIQRRRTTGAEQLVHVVRSLGRCCFRTCSKSPASLYLALIYEEREEYSEALHILTELLSQPSR